VRTLSSRARPLPMPGSCQLTGFAPSMSSPVRSAVAASIGAYRARAIRLAASRSWRALRTQAGASVIASRICCTLAGIPGSLLRRSRAGWGSDARARSNRWPRSASSSCQTKPCLSLHECASAGAGGVSPLAQQPAECLAPVQPAGHGLLRCRMCSGYLDRNVFTNSQTSSGRSAKIACPLGITT